MTDKTTITKRGARHMALTDEDGETILLQHAHRGLYVTAQEGSQVAVVGPIPIADLRAALDHLDPQVTHNWRVEAEAQEERADRFEEERDEARKALAALTAPPTEEQIEDGAKRAYNAVRSQLHPDWDDLARTEYYLVLARAVLTQPAPEPEQDPVAVELGALIDEWKLIGGERPTLADFLASRGVRAGVEG